MGRIQHASPIEQMYDVSSCCCAPVVVRNTFLEVKDLEPPTQSPITRARTAPEGEPRTLTRAVATGLHICSDTASCASTDCEALSRGSSPHARPATPLAGNLASPLQLLLPQHGSSSCSTTDDEASPSAFENTVPQLRVRNTFIEAFMPAPPKPALNRSRSVPLSNSDHSDESDEETDGVVPDYAVSTPTGEDSPRLSTGFTSFGDLPRPVPAAFDSAMGTATGSQPVWGMPPMIPVPMWMVAGLPTSSGSSAPVEVPAQQPATPVTPVPENPTPVQQDSHASSSSKAKPAAAKATSSTDDASKRRPAPTASESRASDLISDACNATLEHRNSAVWALSRKDATSSALVQKAIEIVAEELSEATASGDEEAWNEANFRVEALIAGLHGHTHTAIEHPHANYVVQKVADLLPTEHVAFLVSELKGKAVWASKHRFGCRTMLRLVRHSTAAGWAGEAAAGLVDELLANTTELSCDKFGNYVMQEVLEHGLPEQVRKLADMLLNDVVEASGTQHGSRVVEKALRLCAAPQIQVLADELLRNPSAVQNLACSEYGCFVLRALVKSEQHGRRTSMVLRPLHSDLRKTRQGRRLLGPVFGNSQIRA